MDFDEYDYLEKTVENPELQKLKEAVNGGDELVKSGDKDRSRSSWRREEEDDDEDRKYKKSRSGDDTRDHDQERNRGKGSSRHRSRSRERERSDKDGERHKSSREHRDKDRDKDREREKDREVRNGGDHDQDKGRSKEKVRERERERDRESGRKERDREESGRDGDHDRRSRSHSVRQREDVERIHDREYREKSRDREIREKSRDREYREKSHDREIRDKESRRHKERKDEAIEPEADPERDQRTVFAYQLPLRADERDIFEFFSRAGKVRDVRLIMDRNSRRSKGVGDPQTPSKLMHACKLTYHAQTAPGRWKEMDKFNENLIKMIWSQCPWVHIFLLRASKYMYIYIEFYDVMSVPMAIALSGQPIRGQPVMVKPSEAEKNLVQSTSTTAAGLSGAARKLYVGNLVPNITEDQLRVFARLEDAKAAQILNGQLDIGGRVMKVSAVTDQPGMQDAGATTGDLDDDENIGFALNASSRAELMKKLDRSSNATSVTGTLPSAVNSTGIPVPMSGVVSGVSPLVAPLSQPAVPLGGLPGAGLSTPVATLPIDTIGVPSECLLLKNMFDPKLETEPDFDLDIKEDVQDECSKYGALKHIFVDKDSEGFVYLKFGTTQAAMSAQRALHGRWFAGKMISATFIVPQNYEAKFPESKS